MHTIVCMGERETWYTIGFVTDKLLQALKETVRREKLEGTGASCLASKSAPAPSAGEPLGEPASGTHVKKMT